MPAVPTPKNARTCYVVRAVPNTPHYHGDGVSVSHNHLSLPTERTLSINCQLVLSSTMGWGGWCTRYRSAMLDTHLANRVGNDTDWYYWNAVDGLMLMMDTGEIID